MAPLACRTGSRRRHQDAESFDTIDQELLRRLVARRIRARRVFKMLRQWLQAGVVAAGQGPPTTMGAPPGGVLSPGMAHIDLHGLDL